MTEKVSIACIHLAKGQVKKSIIIKNKPDDKRDSGKLFLCQKCADRFGEIVKNKEIDNFITIHESCLKKVKKVAKNKN